MLRHLPGILPYSILPAMGYDKRRNRISAVENPELSMVRRSKYRFACFSISQEFCRAPFYRHWDIINAEIRVNAAENTELSMVRRSEYGLAFFTIYQEFYRTPVKSGVSGTLKLWSLLLKIQSYRQLQGQNIALHASPSARNSTVLFSARSGVPVKLKLWSLLL